MGDYIVVVDGQRGPQGPQGPVGDVTPAATAAKVAAAESAANAANSAASIAGIAGNVIDYKTTNLHQYIAQLIANGGTVAIDCRGDSTTAGYDPNDLSKIVANPAPYWLQYCLQSFYQSTNVIVANNGIGGTTTADALPIWDTEMENSTAQIIYINYGMNDGYGSNAIALNTFRSNLVQLVQIARKRGKNVVLQTPNMALSVGSLGSIPRMEAIKQTAEIVRQVAKELNCPLVDVFLFCEKMFSKGLNPATHIGDGVHPTADMYRLIGVQMVKPLCSVTIAPVSFPQIIPSINPNIKTINGVGHTPVTGSITGWSAGFTKAGAFIYVDKPGSDLYLAVAHHKESSSSCGVKIDGNLATALNIKDANINLDNFALDREYLIAENITPGLHFVEFYTNTTDLIAITYFAFRETRQVVNIQRNDTGKISAISKGIVTAGDIYFTTADPNHNHALFRDIPTTRTIKDITVEVKAILAGNEGFSLFCFPYSTPTSYSMGTGLTFLLDSSGNPILVEGVGPNFNSSMTKLNTTNYTAVSHTYTVLVTVAGFAMLLIDGVHIGTYQMTNAAHAGGFFGIWKYGAGIMKIDKVVIY